MSLSGINFSGLGSGIDTESIIGQLSKLNQRPITVLQARQAEIQQQQSAVAQVTAAVAGLQAAASTLNSSTGFTLVKAGSSDAEIASVSAQPGAQTGAHSLQVTQLAKAQKIGAVAQSSQTTGLGVSGQIIINGKAITVAGTDSLQTLASNINGAQVGVNATIVTPTTDTFTLVLTSSNSGTANTISLTDTAGGSILQNTLGLIGPATSVRHAVTNGAASNLFSDSSTSVGTLLGLTTPQTGTVQINGSSVAIDFATDSLTAIATKINGASITGVTASVVAATDPVSGASRQQLKIVGSATPTFTDANNVLTNLGVLQNAVGHELIEAKDSKFKLDGLDITRASNSVNDVISGVTINLLKETGSPTAEINVAPDVDGIKSNITTFVNQYNQLARTISNLSGFDSQTLRGGPLFGDVTIQNTLDSLTDILTGNVSGLTGTKTLLAHVGVTLGQDNIFNINEGQLTAALNSNLSEVSRIFQAAGVATDSSVSFISATEKTKASTSGGYAVAITQAAAQATVTGGTAHSANDNADVEVLTFAGGQFGSSGKTVLLNANSTLDDIVSQINSAKGLSDLITAANLGGLLQLTSRQYGSANSFTVTSSQPAAANNSGVGNATLIATGYDVAGTINGESATGKGQFLTGNGGNLTTEALQLRITATSIGSLGTVTFTQGLSAQAGYYAKSASEAIGGSLSQYSDSLNTQVNEITDHIKELQDRVKEEEKRLRLQFATMESSVARVKAAGNGLAGLASLNAK